VSFNFFSWFYGIRLIELQIDPQLESTILLKARGLHSIRNVILRMAFSIWFLRQEYTSTIEDLQEENSRMLGDYSRKLQDYPRISWSTFQPRDASSTLEDFWLVVLRDIWELLVKAIKTTRNYPARLQSTRGLIIWTSLGPLLRWVLGPTTQWAPGTTRLVLHGT
jgi:predicted ATP-grasp superfamily ATP-dependent carboligase